MTDHFYIDNKFCNNSMDPVDVTLQYTNLEDSLNKICVIDKPLNNYNVYIAKLEISLTSIPVNHVSHLSNDLTLILTGQSISPIKKNLKEFFRENKTNELYAVNDFIVAINKCLDSMYLDYKSIKNKNFIQPLYYGYDANSQKLFVTINNTDNTDNKYWPYRLHFNSDVFNLFGNGFSYMYNSSSKMYEMNYGYYETDNSNVLVKITQSYSTVLSMYDYIKLIVTSDPSDPCTLFETRFLPNIKQNKFVYEAESNSGSICTTQKFEDVKSLYLKLCYVNVKNQIFPIKLRSGDYVNIKLKLNDKQ